MVQGKFWVVPGISLLGEDEYSPDERTVIRRAAAFCYEAGIENISNCIKERLRENGLEKHADAIADNVIADILRAKNQDLRVVYEQEISKIKAKPGTPEYKRAVLAAKRKVIQQWNNYQSFMAQAPSEGTTLYSALKSNINNLYDLNDDLIRYKALKTFPIPGEKFFDFNSPTTEDCASNREDLQGLTLTPYGYGPGCDKSKERGEYMTAKCNYERYIRCMEELLVSQVEIIVKIKPLVKKEYTQRKESFYNRNDPTRGEKGIADPQEVTFNTNFLKLNRRNMAKCLRVYTGPSPKQPNKKNPQKVTTSGAVTPTTNTNETEENEQSYCRENAYTHNSPTRIPQNVKLGSGGGGGTIPPLGAILSGLGPKKGTYEGCACDKCIVIGAINISTNASRKTNPTPEELKQASNTLLETEEKEDAETIPYLIGKNPVRGTIISIDKYTSTVCKDKRTTYRVLFKISANPVIVKEIRLFGTPLTSVKFRTYYNKEGHTLVVVDGLTEEQVNNAENELVFHTVELVPPDMQEMYLHTLDNVAWVAYNHETPRMVVKFDNGEVWEINPLTFEKIKKYNIAPPDKFRISPTGDVYWLDNTQHENVRIYVPELDKEFGVHSPTEFGVMEMDCTYDGWIDLTHKQPYFYDYERGNPGVDLNTWIPWLDYIKPIRAYNIITGRKYAFHPNTEEDAQNVVAVPSHKFHAEFMERQPLYSSESTGAAHIIWENLTGAFNNEKYEITGYVCYEPYKIYIRYFNHNYYLENAPVTDGGYENELFDHEYKPKAGFAKFGSCSIKFPVQISLDWNSDKYMNVFVNPDSFSLIAGNETHGWFKCSNIRPRKIINPIALENDYFLGEIHAEQIAAPRPKGKIVSAHNATTKTAPGVWLPYIDEYGAITRINTIDGSHETITRHNIVQDNISVQFVFGENLTDIIYLTTDGKLKRPFLLENTNFDVAKGLERLFKYRGIPAERLCSAPSYLDGFALYGDNIDALLENIYLLTGVSVHFDAGYPIIQCTHNDSDIANLRYYAKKTKKLYAHNTPENIEYKYYDTDIGLRRTYYYYSDSDKLVTLTTHTTTNTPEPLGYNASRLSLEERNGINMLTSFQEYLLRVHGVEEGTISLQKGASFLKILPDFEPLHPTGTLKENIPYCAFSPTLVTNGKLFDVANGYGFIVSENERENTLTIKGETFDVDRLNDLQGLYGVVNGEFITFTHATANTDNTITLHGVRRGQYGTEYALKFHAISPLTKYSKNKGVFVGYAQKDMLLYQPFPKRAGPEYYVFEQNGMEVQIPVEERKYEMIPAPTNLVVTDRKIRWTPQSNINGVQKGTGEYVVIMWWGERRDVQDALYIYNSINKYGDAYADLINGKIENKDLYVAVVNGAEELLWEDVDYRIDFTSMTERKYASIVPFESSPWPNMFDNVGYWTEDFKALFEAATATEKLDVHISTGYTPGIGFVHPRHEEWVKRIANIQQYGWHPSWDGVFEVIQNLRTNYPNIGRLYDYWGDPAKVGRKTIYPAVNMPSAYPSIDPAFQFPDKILPIKHIIGYFTQPRVSQNFQYYIIDPTETPPANGNWHSFDDTRMWWEHEADGKVLMQPFTERMYFVQLLLDQQFNLHPPTSQWYALLRKYGCAPPNTLETCDASGEKITQFFLETITKHLTIFQRPQDAKSINILIAERQEDGNLGHFEVYTNIVKMPDEEFCEAREKTYRPADIVGMHENKQTMYAVISHKAIGIKTFSVTYVYKPNTNPYFLHNTKLAGYVVIDNSKTKTMKAACYSIVWRETKKVKKLVGYALFTN